MSLCSSTAPSAQGGEPAAIAGRGATVVHRRRLSRDAAKDIARAADVGHGTFYLHSRQADCFLAFAEEACLELECSSATAWPVSGRAQIRALLIALID